MKKVKSNYNSLLKRNELVFSLELAGAPVKSDMLQKIAEEFKQPAEHVVVNKIINGYGTQSFMIDAFLYDSLEAKNSVEIAPKVKGAAA